MKYGSLLQNVTCICLTFSIFIAGCAGTNPHPVDRYMPGDEKKSCKALYAEMQDIDNQVEVKNKKIKDRDTWNAVFFVSGFFLIVPWFLIDCKNSHESEIEALEARKKNLKIIYAEKDCSITENIVGTAN